ERRKVDCRRHVPLGNPDGAHGLHTHGAGILCRALPRGRCRGRFFSSGGGLPDALVPGRGPREGRGGFLRGDATLLRHWLTSRRPVAWIDLARLLKLGGGVYFLGGVLGCTEAGCPFLFFGHSHPNRVALP